MNKIRTKLSPYINKYCAEGQTPLLFINLLICFYALGIYVAKNNLWQCKYPFLVLGLTIVITISSILYRRNFTILLCLILLFLIGNMRGYTYFQLPAHNISHFINQTHTLEGVIIEEPRLKQQGDQTLVNYVVQVKSLNIKNQNHGVSGKIYLHTLLAPNTTPANIGDTIKAKGKIKAIIGYHNPGLIDTELAAQTQGIYARCSAYTDPITIIKKDHSFNLYRFASVLRNKILNFFLKNLPPDNAYMLYAMLFGGYTGLNPEILEAFTTTGIVHILSVSGSHISLLAGFILILGNYLKLNKLLLLTLLTLIIFIYTALCGFVPPVIRAAIMGILSIFALTIGHQKDGKHLLSLTALIMLLINPLLLFNISFQLSFAATAGLIYLMPNLASYFSFLPKFLANGLALTLSAQIATAPLLAWYFNNLSLSSLLANLISVPILEFIIILGLNSALLLFFIPIFGSKLLLLCDNLLNLANILTLKIANLPYATIYLPTFSLLIICLYYLFIYLCINNCTRKYLWQKAKKYSIFTLTSIMLISGYGLYQIYQPKPLAIHFIDVGQGDAALIITPHKHAILIDTGGIPKRGPQDIDTFDIGKRVILPYLHHYGVQKLDYLILSHAHLDHIGGAAAVIHKMPVKQLLISPESKQIYATALKISPTDKILANATLATKDLNFTLDGVKFEVLQPPMDNKIRQGNAASNVVKLTYENFTALFTGDLEAEGEEELLASGTSLKADLLKVGHHGSNTSSTPKFIQHISPSYGIISCGAYNSFGHPKPSTLETLTKQNVAIYRTDQLGAITFTIQNSQVKIHSYYSTPRKIAN